MPSRLRRPPGRHPESRASESRGSKAEADRGFSQLITFRSRGIGTSGPYEGAQTLNHIIAASDQSTQTTDRPTRHAYVTPLVNVQSNEEGFVLQAEMPRVNKTGIEVTVENGDLILVGHR